MLFRSGFCQWFNFNAAGHRRLIYSAGFEVLEAGRPYGVRFNVHPKPGPGIRNRVRAAAFQALTGDDHPGVLHQLVLARPRV